MSKIYILRNNNAENLLTNCWEPNCPVNNYVTYAYCISSFSEWIEIFKKILYFFKHFFENFEKWT